MSFLISPLEIKLDPSNPRLFGISEKSEEEIRNFLASTQEICQLAKEINKSQRLNIGERIVVVKEKEKFVVVEGNRRVCAIQFLLNRDLIPEKFKHKIPHPSTEAQENLKEIEVDEAKNRKEAIALMANRHIDGINKWSSLAKKNFFASKFIDGISISELSGMTNIKASTIQNHIRDYKLFQKALKLYKGKNPDFDEDFTTIKIDPFLRLFRSTQEIEGGRKVSTGKLLKISYNEENEIKSELPKEIFEEVLIRIFADTVDKKIVDTRGSLFDVEGIEDLLKNQGRGDLDSNQEETVAKTEGKYVQKTKRMKPLFNEKTISPTPEKIRESPRKFFEKISFETLNGTKYKEHEALIMVLNDLFIFSTKKINFGGQKLLYQALPIPAGMLLRTGYEQALILQLKKVSLWEELLKGKESRLVTLKEIEKKICKEIKEVFSDSEMRRAFQRIISYKTREFLNDNVHNLGRTCVTGESLEGISKAGIFFLIQEIVNKINE